MDESNVHFGRGPGSDNVLPPCLDPKQIFFTNLQLLGFDTAAMEMKYKIPFNKEMFNLPNKTGAEVVLHFLFNRLNATMSQQQFRDCWPVTDKKSEAAFRKVCCIWLQNIQKEEADARLPRINASLFLSPGGDKFCHLLFAFSTYVILHVIRKEHGVKDSGLLGYPMLTSQNKDLGFVMETTVNCAAIRHRKSFFETLGQTASAKQRWQSHGDELIKSLRGQIKEMREMEREKRDQIQLAAHKGLDRGSPIPASRRSQDFDMSTHMARRAQRVQQVRGLWKDIEGYLERSQEEQDIVSSVLDKTQEKYSLDAANIQISIPHLMLRECEQEMRRRQVDNIYEGGELNLMSILQLWNLALRMYIQRLQKDGLKDLSDEANNMRSQAHTHQAYLANTSLLREKMAREIPHRKKTVARLRNQFRSEVTTSGLAMAAPSPPVTFDPPRGHSGATPTGPVVQMSPDQAETPEAAVDIANFISRTSRKTQMESFQTRAFGLSSNQNRNQNNSMRLPKPAPSSGAGGSSVGRQQPKSSQSRRGRGDIQPRVVRHISRQPAAPPASSHKMSAPGKDRAQVSSRQHLASTPEKISRTQCADLDKTPVPADHNNSAAETARDRAHNILADKIVWSVMHEEEGEEGFSELPHDLGLTSPRTSPTSVPMASASARAKGSPTSLHSHTLADSQHKTKASSHRRADKSAVSDSDCVGSPFVRTVSPVTLVQQAHMSDADSGSDGVSQGSIKDVHTERKRTEGDGEEPEAEDINIENPIAALNEGVFASHDMIHRSPLAVDISRMWQDAISDDAEHKDSSSDRNGATGWLDTNRSNASTARTLTPRARWSSSSSEGTASSPPPQQDTARSHGQDRPAELDVRSPQSAGVEVEMPSALFEGRSEHSMSQTRINKTLTFVTSFEEDSDALEPVTAQDSTVEWEEHLSALYDDQEDGEISDSHGNLAQGSDDAVAFNSALNSFFESKTPVTGHSKVPSRTDSSPLISFTPHKPSVMVSGGGLPQMLTRGEDVAHGMSCLPQAESDESAVKPGEQTMNFSPENSSDKENCAAVELQEDFNQTPSKQRPVLGQSFGATSGKGGTRDGTTAFEDDILGEDDFLNMSGASPFNESFTPLRAGMLVQGKSPGRSTVKNLSGGQLPQGADHLDDTIAAQLSRLRRMKAEAFRDLDRSEHDGQGAGEGISAGSSSLLSTSHNTGTVDREEQTHRSEPVDIFGEDDSILLPTSP